METAYLIFLFSVVVISMLLFFMKIRYKPSPFLELILQILGKLVPFYCMAYAVVELFKYFGVIY